MGYFGEKKVENVSEGKVIHVFKEGLILKMRTFLFTSASVGKHPVFSKFLMEDPVNIKEDRLLSMINQATLQRGKKHCL